MHLRDNKGREIKEEWWEGSEKKAEWVMTEGRSLDEGVFVRLFKRSPLDTVHVNTCKRDEWLIKRRAETQRETSEWMIVRVVSGGFLPKGRRKRARAFVTDRTSSVEKSLDRCSSDFILGATCPTNDGLKSASIRRRNETMIRKLVSTKSTRWWIFLSAFYKLIHATK